MRRGGRRKEKKTPLGNTFAYVRKNFKAGLKARNTYYSKERTAFRLDNLHRGKAHFFAFKNPFFLIKERQRDIKRSFSCKELDTKENVLQL